MPTLLHWTYRQSDPTFLPFLVLLHLGTAGALLILFWREWVNIIRGFFTAAVRGRIETTDERLAMLLVMGTVPTGMVGVFFQKQLQGLFASPRVAASLLIVKIRHFRSGRLDPYSYYCVAVGIVALLLLG